MLKNNVIITLILVAVFNLMSCTEKFKPSNLSQEEEQRVRKIGQTTAGILLKSLQKELKTTITNDGMLAALSVCNISAIQLTDSIKRSVDEVIEIKRTSLRFRNPKNSPDDGEREGLIYFQKKILKTGKMPEDMIIKVNDTKGQYYRYYKPLTIKPLCLSCHGQSDSIVPELSDHLQKLYPQDHATGYSIDQFRGLISITVR